MTKVISVHEYRLRSGVSEQRFVNAVLDAKKRGLLRLPGLVDYYLVEGIKVEFGRCCQAGGKTNSGDPIKTRAVFPSSIVNFIVRTL